MEQTPNSQSPATSYQSPARRLVGIGGLTRSGKDTLAEIFIEQGWFGVSLGDIVREQSRKRHAKSSDPISVANMTETANWLRTNKGADFALNIALKKFKKVQNKFKGLVLYSVRAPVEVDFILSRGGELIWVDAESKVRHERAMQQLREGEKPITLKEFNEHEKLQLQPQPNLPKTVQMNTSYVKNKATVTIENNGTKQEFLVKAKKLINTSF